MTKKKVIWKWEIERKDRTLLEIPRDSEVLKADKQNGSLVLWVLVDPSSPSESREFQLWGTGQEIEDWSHLNYVDSIFDGPYVWHLFERIPPER